MSEEKDYLSIKDFIIVVDRTEQSIYKRLKNKDDKLNNYSKKFSKGTKLHKNAIKEVYGIDLTDEQIFGLVGKVEQKVEKVEKVEKLDFAENIERAESQQKQVNNDKIVEILEREIKNKDKIIENLTLQLADTTRMLDQQQQLSIIDKQTILQLQAGTEKKRKSIFDIFKKKDK